MARLGDVCSIRSSNHSADKDKNWLLNLDVVEQQTGRVLEYYYVPESGLDGSIISFDSGNVLYSKLRPNLNKVVIPEKNGYATSEMLPLYPDTKQITREYLACYLRSPGFVEWAVSKTAGAKMPRLGTKELLNKEIPLPSVDLQKRITETLFLVDSLISMRKKQLQKLDDLIRSRFVEMFGDSVSNTMGWEQDSLLNVTSKIGSGATPKGGKENYQAEGISLIRSMNVYDGRFEYRELAHISEEQAQQLDNVTVKENDVFINITGASVARSCIVPNNVLPARVNQHVAIIRCKRDQLHPVFANNLFLSSKFKEQLLSIGESGGATRQAITKQQLESLIVILPPMTLQNKFADDIKRIETTRLTICQTLDKLEQMKQALMQKYFG